MKGLLPQAVCLLTEVILAMRISRTGCQCDHHSLGNSVAVKAEAVMPLLADRAQSAEAVQGEEAAGV